MFDVSSLGFGVWGSHHHLLHTAQRVNSKIIWSNMGLLFFLSLIPFSTGWMGENHFDKIPVAVYAINLLMCAIAFFILQASIMTGFTHSTVLSKALQKQRKKGMLSLLIYILSIPCAFYYPIVSAIMFVTVSVMWVIPDRNIERALGE